jgi:serine/threonine protein kinase
MQEIPADAHIGGFLIIRRLAEGGMGSIYEAIRPGAPEPVALKVLLPVHSGEDEYRQRFEREVTALQSLRHPHIIPILDCGEEDGAMYFAMRLVRGPSLFSLLARQRFSPLMAWQILDPVAHALDYAHSRQIIHRDIKPGNILIEPTNVDGRPGNHVYLADFGLSKITSAASSTEDGISLGTPQYMSPEQVLGQPLAPQTDLYSLAVLMYEALLGRLPFYGRKPQQIALKHVHEQAPSPRSLHPDFPKPLDAVLMRAMAKAPQDRYATAGEFSIAYARAVEDIDPVARKAEYWVGPPE